MEIKNNLEEKAKFFAQYWGQKVGKEWCSKKNDGFEGNYFINPINIPDIQLDYLELTPLSQISDDDAEYLDQLLANSFDEYGCYYGMGSRHYWQPDEVDYLRSKGYALPWMGITVEEQIKLNWIKLKDNE